MTFNDLIVGDRFFAFKNLWTKIDCTIARQHGKESIALGKDGYGYKLDAICSFEGNEEIIFIPPKEATHDHL